MRAPAVRRPAAAGAFYPDDGSALVALIDRLLGQARPPDDAGSPVGLVVPHAGYVYSGPVAATGYALLPRIPDGPRRVAVLGPAHFVPLIGAAVPAAAAWATPIGEVPVDAELRAAAAAAGAAVDDRPHAGEHAVEVQLPFLQRLLGARPLLPVAVGLCAPGTVADLIGRLADLGALVIVSTDLSHYHDDATARRLDRRTAAAVVDRDPAGIRDGDACGLFALRGLVEHARRRALSVRLLDLRTSAETAGDPDRVVGYGAFALTAA